MEFPTFLNSPAKYYLVCKMKKNLSLSVSHRKHLVDVANIDKSLGIEGRVLPLERSRRPK